MIFFSTGLPSRFAEWCDAFIWRLATATAAAELVSANTPDEVAAAAIRCDCDRLVVGARQPTAELATAIEGARCPVLVALDDPMLALSNLVERHGLELLPAVRATATSCANVVRFIGMAGALVLVAREHGRDRRRTAAKIAEHFGFRPGGADVEAVIAELAGLWNRTDDAACAAGPPALDNDGAAVASRALSGYRDCFAGRGLGEIIWARELFFQGDDPSRPASEVIDVAGGVRNLLFGPFIALPAGRWAATVILAVSREAADMSFAVEVVAGPLCTCLAQTTIVPSQEGVCQAILAFSIDALTDQPISLRVANARPATGGRIALGQVTLNIRVDATPPIPADLSSALGF